MKFLKTECGPAGPNLQLWQQETLRVQPACYRNVVYRDRGQAQGGVLHRWHTLSEKREPALRTLQPLYLKFGLGFRKHWPLPFPEWARFFLPLPGGWWAWPHDQLWLVEGSQTPWRTKVLNAPVRFAWLSHSGECPREKHAPDKSMSPSAWAPEWTHTEQPWNQAQPIWGLTQSHPGKPSTLQLTLVQWSWS